MFDAPQLAGTPHAGLHFVGDEQDFVFVADLAQARPEVIRWLDGSRFALYWLLDDCGDVVANFASDAQLLITGIGVTVGYVVDVIVQRQGGLAEHGLAGE